MEEEVHLQNKELSTVDLLNPIFNKASVSVSKQDREACLSPYIVFKACKHNEENEDAQIIRLFHVDFLT